ncbi:LemA family protein [Sphingomonas sp. NIBR02145]|uniref:LemA family protein n=1 Tax=Sphingomonas sp. NIBR02145 TaxID=3014784 RepID=UPI0022B3DEB0|nr:LemA family protein [Sphingomonas sp. NIBR02145]WHU01842.1 LemA family protein [Sphingomonas sp. NIBR02145]
MKFRALLALAGAALLAGCGLNSVPTAEENAKARWADVQANYQRRADTIPALVNTVKGAAASEGKILNDVVSARAKATQIQVTGDDLTDENKMSAYNQAQAGLTLSLQRLQEAYPQLQSQGNFKTLMDQIEGSNNRITIAVRDYNAAVQAYNTRIRTFPDAIGAKIFYGAKPIVPFKAEAGAERMPDVSFGNSN